MPPKKLPSRRFKVHDVKFKGKPCLLVCRSRQAAPCPLLALCNLLLLREPRDTALDTSKGNDGTRTVSLKNVVNYVLAVLCAKIKAADRGQVMKDYMDELEELQNFRMVCPIHTGTGDYNASCASDKSVFIALDVPRRHAHLPGPEDEDLRSLIAQDESYLYWYRLYNRYVEGTSEVTYDESMMRVVKRVLINRPEFTKFGLGRLCQDTSDDELFIFCLNQDFHVVYKKDGELFLLATDEEMLSTYHDLMWIGLDENFNHENPAETKQKLTSSFSPVNEKWISNWEQIVEGAEGKASEVQQCANVKPKFSSKWNQFLKEHGADPTWKFEKMLPEKVEQEICLPTKVGIGGAEGKASEIRQSADARLTSTFSRVDEKENERKCDKTETSVPQEEAHTTCLPTEVDTDNSHIQTVQHSRDRHKDAEAKHSKIAVDTRFLRFVNRRIVTFSNFTKSYVMYKIYQYKGINFNSTSYFGRLIPKGYLDCIFEAHRSGYSWNGDIKVEQMLIEVELIDGVYIGDIHCFITTTPMKGFNKEYAECDLEAVFVRILFPTYLSQECNRLPFYFKMFEADIHDMPEWNDPPEKLQKFQKYMSHHFFRKAPLTRSSFVTGIYTVCDSEILHTDFTQPKPRYPLLSVRTEHEFTNFGLLSDEIKKVSHRVQKHVFKFNEFTYWDAIELGSHSKIHLMSHTKVNGIQEIQDPLITDLVVEKELEGLLSLAIKFMIEETNFEGNLKSTWAEFAGSEPRDDEENIVYLCGGYEEMEAAVEERMYLPRH